MSGFFMPKELHMKVRELVHASARIIGIVASGENMTDAEMSDAVSALNMLLGQWSASRDYVYSTPAKPQSSRCNCHAEVGAWYRTWGGNIRGYLDH